MISEFAYTLFYDIHGFAVSVFTSKLLQYCLLAAQPDNAGTEQEQRVYIHALKICSIIYPAGLEIPTRPIARDK